MPIEIRLIGSAIGNVDRLTGSRDSVHWRVHAGLGHHPAPPLARVSLWKFAIESCIAPTSSLAEPQCSVTRVAQPYRFSQHCLKDRRELAGGRTYDPQHL